MTVGELISKLQAFPAEARVVMFPAEGWMDISEVRIVFEDWVAIMGDEPF